MLLSLATWDNTQMAPDKYSRAAVFFGLADSPQNTPLKSLKHPNPGELRFGELEAKLLQGV